MSVIPGKLAVVSSVVLIPVVDQVEMGIVVLAGLQNRRQEHRPDSHEAHDILNSSQESDSESISDSYSVRFRG